MPKFRADTTIRVPGRGTGQRGRSGKIEAGSAVCRFRQAPSTFKPSGQGYPCRIFPETSTEWDDGYPTSTMVHPDYLWLFDESSGTIKDRIGSEDFSLNAGTITYGNTGDPFGRKSVALTTAATEVLTVTSTPLNITTDAQDGTASLFGRTYVPSAPAATAKLLSKYSAAAGWRLYMLADGSLRFDIHDITTPSLPDRQIALSGNHAGQWFDWALYINRLAGNEAGLMSSVNPTPATANMSIGSISNTSKFELGPFSGADGVPGAQWSYLAGWTKVNVGTQSRVIDLAHFNLFRGA